QHLPIIIEKLRLASLGFRPSDDAPNRHASTVAPNKLDFHSLDNAPLMLREKIAEPLYRQNSPLAKGGKRVCKFIIVVHRRGNIRDPEIIIRKREQHTQRLFAL